MTTTSPTAPEPTALDRPVAATRRRDLPLGLSGVLFAVLLILVVAIPHAGLDTEPTRPPAGSVVTRFFRAHYALEQYQAVMHSVAAVCLLVFLTALAARVRRAAPDSIASRLTAGAGVGMAAIMLLTMVLVSTSISLTGAVDGRVQLWLYEIGWTGHVRCLYLLPVALVPACRVLRSARALPAALAWTGLVLGVLGGVAVLGVLSSATEMLVFPVFLLLILWVLATGVLALTRGLPDPALADPA